MTAWWEQFDKRWNVKGASDQSIKKKITAPLPNEAYGVKDGTSMAAPPFEGVVADFRIHLTYPTDEFNVPKIGQEVAAFFEEEKAAGRTYEVETRQPDELSFRIALA